MPSWFPQFRYRGSRLAFWRSCLPWAPAVHRLLPRACVLATCHAGCALRGCVPLTVGSLYLRRTAGSPDHCDVSVWVVAGLYAYAPAAAFLCNTTPRSRCHGCAPVLSGFFLCAGTVCCANRCTVPALLTTTCGSYYALFTCAGGFVPPAAALPLFVLHNAILRAVLRVGSAVPPVPAALWVTLYLYRCWVVHAVPFDRAGWRRCTTTGYAVLGLRHLGCTARWFHYLRTFRGLHTTAWFALLFCAVVLP